MRVLSTLVNSYGVASTSRLLKIIGLFCKRSLSKRRSSAKETKNLKEPTDCSHPICIGILDLNTISPPPFLSRTHIHTHTRTHNWKTHINAQWVVNDSQPIAFEVSFLQSQNSIDCLVIYVSCATSHIGLATISSLLQSTGLFCKKPYKTDYILQKSPIILRSLLTVACATFRWKETNQIKIGEWDWMTLQMQ